MERKTFLKSVWAVAVACFVPFGGKAVGKSVDIPLETQKPMTYGDWREMSWTRWCKFKPQGKGKDQYDSIDHIDQLVLDLRTPVYVPDGTYECKYKGYRHYPATAELPGGKRSY